MAVHVFMVVHAERPFAGSVPKDIVASAYRLLPRMTKRPLFMTILAVVKLGAQSPLFLEGAGCDHRLLITKILLAASL